MSSVFDERNGSTSPERNIFLCQQNNNNNLDQQLFSYTSNDFENLHCNQMPGYFWPQALTWNSVIVLKKIEPFMLILISKQLVFFPVLFYAVTKTDDLSFINRNLSQRKTNNCKNPDNWYHYPASKRSNKLSTHLAWYISSASSSSWEQKLEFFLKCDQVVVTG